MVCNSVSKKLNKNYTEKSIDNYKILIDSFGLSNEKVYLNLAHSYLLSKDTLKALFPVS